MTPERPLVTDSETAVRLLAALVDAREEAAEALYLDPKWRLCGRHRFDGGGSAVDIDVRTLIAKGLAADARYVILAHNNPSGDPEPSQRDLALTRRLGDALRLVDMPLADHLILARGGTMSFRERGLL